MFTPSETTTPGPELMPLLVQTSSQSPTNTTDNSSVLLIVNSKSYHDDHLC